MRVSIDLHNSFIYTHILPIARTAAAQQLARFRPEQSRELDRQAQCESGIIRRRSYTGQSARGHCHSDTQDARVNEAVVCVEVYARLVRH